MKPSLILDLSGPDGQIYALVGRAVFMLSGRMRDNFLDEIWELILQGPDVEHERLLAAIDKYVSLEDTSQRYPDYSLRLEAFDGKE